MPARKGPNLELWKAAVVDDKELPPLQPGEHMTVGQVRHPEMQETFADEFRKWYQKLKGQVKKDRSKVSAGASAASYFIVCSLVADQKKLPIEVRQTVEGEVAELLGFENVTCKQLRQLVQAYPKAEGALQLLLSNSYRLRRQQQHQRQVRRHAADDSDSEQEFEAPNTDGNLDDDDDYPYSDIEDDDFEDQHSWFALKTDMPVSDCVRAGKVPETDERVPLRGMNGIWATRDVHAGHVLGPYRHYCMFSNTYNRVLDKPKASWKAPASMWKLELESYVCNEDECAVQSAKLGGLFSLFYSGWGYGNYTGYANDPHSDPLGNLYAEGKPDDYLGPYMKDENGKAVSGNCMCGVVRIMGWAYLFMYTLKPVKKGQEFAYDYGYSYWSFVKKALTDGQRELEALEYRKKLERLERLQTQMTSGLTTSIQTPSASVAAPTASVAQAHAGAEVSSPIKPRAPAPAVSGLTSLGACMQDMQLTSGLSGPQKQQTARTSGVQLPGDQQQTQTEGVGESPAGARQLGKAASAALSRPQASAVGASSAIVADNEVPDYEDDVSSAFPPSLLAYRDQPFTEEQQQRLQDNITKLKQQQLNTKILDEQGRELLLHRISDPSIAKLIHDTEMKLSRILFRYPDGIAFKKLKERRWWNKEKLEKYEHDQDEFIRRRDLCFECSTTLSSPNAVVRLTDEWREELEPIARLERWQRPQERQRGQKRTITEVRYVKEQDPELVAELRQKKQKLDTVQADLGKFVGLLRDVHLFHQRQRIQLPHQLQRRLQEVLSADQTGQQASNPSAVAPAAAGAPAASGAAWAGFVGVPIPGAGGGDADSDSGGGGYSSDKSDQREAPEAESEGDSHSRGATANGEAGPAAAAAGGFPIAGRVPTDPRLARRSSDGVRQQQHQQQFAPGCGPDPQRQHTSVQPGGPHQHSTYGHVHGQQQDLARSGPAVHLQQQRQQYHIPGHSGQGGSDTQPQHHPSVQPGRREQHHSNYVLHGQQQYSARPGPAEQPQQQQCRKSGPYQGMGRSLNGSPVNQQGNLGSYGQQQSAGVRRQNSHESDSRCWDGRNVAEQQRSQQMTGQRRSYSDSRKQQRW